MEKYLKRHEAFIRQQLASPGAGTDWQALARFHRTQIGYMQHERLIHLLVTLFFGLCALLLFLFLLLHPQVVATTLILLVLALLIPYLVHYFRLENGVQRWYHLANELELRAGGVSEHDEDGPIEPPAR